MSQPFHFERLVELCRRTHEETRDSVVRTVAHLAFSCDGHEVRRLARQGQVVEKASDLIKDSVMLEFLGLEETPAYSESDLETAIIAWFLLCDRKNDAVVALTLPEDASIYASKYQLYLPSMEELADQVARVRREIEGKGGRGNG